MRAGSIQQVMAHLYRRRKARDTRVWLCAKPEPGTCAIEEKSFPIEEKFSAIEEKSFAIEEKSFF